MAPNDPVSGTDAGALRVALEGFVRGGARWSDLEAAGLHVVERGEYGLSFEAAGPVPLIAPSPTDLGAGMLAHAGDPWSCATGPESCSPSPTSVRWSPPTRAARSSARSGPQPTGSRWARTYSRSRGASPPEPRARPGSTGELESPPWRRRRSGLQGRPRRNRASASAPREARGAPAAAAFPTLEAIFTRRARRFALGAEMTGPLAYRSRPAPVPLAYEEEAILVAAATGVTGVVREEWPFAPADGAPTGADKLQTFTGRPWPSPLAIHGTELFWTNDDGTFMPPPARRAARALRAEPVVEEQHALYKGALQLLDHRLDIPCRRPNLFRFNEWIVNREGTTLFIPISDVTRQCISAMLLYFDRPHGYYLKDLRLGADPLRPFMRPASSKHAHPYDIGDFERWQMVDMNGVEPGLMVQNLMLTTQALGLGGHPFSGGKGRVTMGGEQLWTRPAARARAGPRLHVPPGARRRSGRCRGAHPGRTARRLRGRRPAVPRDGRRGRPRARPALGRTGSSRLPRS